MGKIKLPTGKIVANDPLIAEATDPFTICVTPGEYPVMLYVNHSDGDQRVAFAEIRFQEDMPVRFAPALVEGQDLEELEEQILAASQELEKLELQNQDSQSAQNVERQNQANARNRAAEDYNAAVTQGNSAVTEAKAGDVFYSDPNRIVLFYHDAEILAEYTKIGTFDATEKFVTAVEENTVA